MEVVKLYWFKHNCKEGQYSSATVHRSISIALQEGIDTPKSIEDYTINLNRLPNLEVEEENGL